MATKRPDLTNSFIDLYAGCGGSILGMIMAGWKCLAGVEWDLGACFTMWSNMALPSWTHFKIDPQLQAKATKWMERHNYDTASKVQYSHIPGDDWLTQDKEISPMLSIWCISMLDLEPEELMEVLDIEPGELGLISGGPPCQGFSYAGHRNFDDPRNQHPFRFLYFIKKIRPRIFKMENVPGLLTLGRKKHEKYGPFIQWIINAANDAGYHISWEIHDAKDYGVPQSRRRVFFTGIRNDIWESGWRPQPMVPTHTWSFHDSIEDGTLMAKLATGKQPWVNVHEAIGDLNVWDLSSSRDVDCKHLPEGHEDRREHSADNIKTDDDGYLWYPDRFTGKLFKGNHIADYAMGHANYYKSCRACGKLNIIVRSECHYCKQELSPIPDFNYLVTTNQ